jgi:UDP-N-acetylmuramate: L-alanyl-gamma-D-glutamyl-meso-diaminopimelate ligase
VFEPRSATSRRNIFQSEYADAFAPADRVIIAATADASSIPEDERMDFGALAADLRARGTEAVAMDRVEEIAATLGANAMEGDVIALLSNGGFGGIHEKVLQLLEERFGEAAG